MAEQTSYRTLSRAGEASYTEKRSKFVAHALPVTSEEEALNTVKEYRRKYYDARHVCWAYRIGTRETTERANDDGEPSSTAGKPILGQIIGRNLTQVLVIVVRYFGGVKLGTGGLIVAYRTAAALALDESKVKEVELQRKYRLLFPFELINPVIILLKQVDADILLSDASLEGYIYTASVPERERSAFEHAAEALYGLRYEEEE